MGMHLHCGAPSPLSTVSLVSPHRRLSFPLTFTTVHFTMVFSFAALWRAYLAWRTPGAPPRTVLSWRDFLRRVVPIAVCTAADVGLSNEALRYVPISLYVMGKSLSIVFILVFGIVARVEPFRWSVLLVICSIVAGIALFSIGDVTEFSLGGFTLIIVASAFSGGRWVLTQILLQKDAFGLSHPADSLYHVTPAMAMSMLPFSAAYEGIPFFSSPLLFRGESLAPAFVSLLLIMMGGVLAAGLHASEFMLINLTSSLTMNVAGIAKEVLSILLAMLVYHDPMSPRGIGGISLTVVGILVYNLLRYRDHRSSSKPRTYESLPIADHDDEDDNGDGIDDERL